MRCLGPVGLAGNRCYHLLCATSAVLINRYKQRYLMNAVDIDDLSHRLGGVTYNLHFLPLAGAMEG